MRILTFSDLHLEFGSRFSLPPAEDGDVLILAGDIVSFENFSPFAHLLDAWPQPVLYVAGNHEYYTQRPMDEDNAKFQRWLAANYQQVTFLLDEGVRIDGVNFFGGTMWTHFDGGDRAAMAVAGQGMNDFRLIQNPGGRRFTPADSVRLHEHFVEKLLAWFGQQLDGPRVVISHHAPVLNPHTKYHRSPLRPAFNSLDMVKIMEAHQPDLWVYGHTHECDDQVVGRTRIISNQRGYLYRGQGFECQDFDPLGCPATLPV
ncbi:MAG: metallophosphoesterase [Bryobacteraceae bacterium]|nr:metallophosphoesterase [Bryobacteraceae bacterium]